MTLHRIQALCGAAYCSTHSDSSFSDLFYDIERCRQTKADVSTFADIFQEKVASSACLW
jgi:hypothetical protein